MGVKQYFAHEGVRYRVLVWGRRVDGAEERVAESGASRGGAPVVLVHGFAQQAESWDAVAREVAVRTGRAVVAIDLVGHGGTDRPKDPRAYDLAAQGAALAAFARELALESTDAPCAVGYSMGGRVLLAALAADPQAFSAVVLESAGLGPTDDAERAVLAERNAAWAARVRAEGVPAFMEWWESLPLFASQRDLPEDMRRALREGRNANDAEALARTFEHAGAHAMPLEVCSCELLARCASAGVPVAYVAGELDAKYRAVAERLARATGAAVAVRIVSGAGHNTHLERPEAFGSILRDVLA